MIRRFTISLMIVLLLCSCEKIFFEKNKESVDPFENFEYLWNECNEKYAYFELKAVAWDSIKTVYSSKLYEGMSEDSLFNVMSAMLDKLEDDHANLISDFNTSFFGISYQAQDNFDWRVIVDNYISSDYDQSGPLAHGYVANNDIGYVRLATFSEPIEPVALDYVLEKYKDTKGIIFDIRENGGGAIENVFKILSRFVASETLVYYSRIKNGVNHNDFTSPSPAVVVPYDGTTYTNKVILLTDRGTYSSGSLLTLAAKAIPNITVIGDTTGGGLGLPNGGQLPNGWTYRFSVTQTLDLDLQSNFEQGVPPDISIAFDWNNLSTDEILERAIMELQ